MPAPGAEGQADGDFAVPCSALHDQHVGQVQTGDRQDQQGHGRQDETDDGIAVPVLVAVPCEVSTAGRAKLDRNAGHRFILETLWCEIREQRLQLRPGDRHAQIRLEPSDDIEPRLPVLPEPGHGGGRPEASQWQPKVGAQERDAGKALRRHTHDLALGAVDAERLTDDLRIAPQPPPTEIAQDRNGSAARLLFLGQETPSPGRCGPQQRKVVRRDVSRPHATGRPAISQGGPHRARLSHDIAEGQAAVPQGPILGIDKPRVLRLLNRAIGQLLRRFDALGAQQQQHIRNAEHDGVGPDPERQGNQRNPREPRRLSQHPSGETNILPQGCHRSTPKTSWNHGIVE
jgi:hypothetical protein